ncbi:vacuolar ATPase assembly integral membrane protein vma21 [Teleopsis dalmanni]|uniref:vacuolar ATPase assembly integral membrane protein vma21 n=1 Tax=Teleopsis dalmanni TaxID=139649 RepID=UPI0018CEC358|nr:vacuolar ATPase assembly integral membrane protein vma21 [Teleopsis dalmanni]
MGKERLNVENTTQLKTKKTEQKTQEEEIVIPVLHDSTVSTYLWLLVFSVLMFTFPFITYYGVHSWLQTSFDFTVFQTNCFSVLAAVLAVNGIICLYVFKAFRENEEPSADEKKEN